MTKSKVDPELIHIQQIRVYKSSITVAENLLDTPPEINGYAFSFEQKSSVNMENQAIQIRINTLLTAQDLNDQAIDVKGEFGVDFDFRIENFNDLVSQKEGEISIDEQLGLTLLTIAYSTTRGIVLQNTQNTILNGVLLPVIDPKKLIQPIS